MILAVAATEMEMQPLLQEIAGVSLSCPTLIGGVGPVETAVRLTRVLCRMASLPAAVVNFGVCGVYMQPEGVRQPALLDLCLAEREVFGDFGIALPDGIVPLDRALAGDIEFQLDERLLQVGRRLLEAEGFRCHRGNFVTVGAASGTSARGGMLRARWRGLCENMEGAAVARVCREFSLPCLELRAVSNHVEDRQTANWRLAEACREAGRAAALIINGLEP